jgi:hypothetical protein
MNEKGKKKIRIAFVSNPYAFVDAYNQEVTELLLFSDERGVFLVSCFSYFLRQIQAVLPEKLVSQSTTITEHDSWRYLRLKVSLEEAEEYFLTHQEYDLRYFMT